MWAPSARRQGADFIRDCSNLPRQLRINLLNNLGIYRQDAKFAKVVGADGKTFISLAALASRR